MWQYNTPYSNELYHYGKIGMHWGVHRANKANYSTASSKVSSISKKNERLSNRINKTEIKRDKIRKKEANRPIRYLTSIGEARYKKNANKVLKKDRKVNKLRKRMDRNTVVQEAYQKRVKELKHTNSGREYVKKKLGA